MISRGAPERYPRNGLSATEAHGRPTRERHGAPIRYPHNGLSATEVHGRPTREGHGAPKLYPHDGLSATEAPTEDHRVSATERPNVTHIMI